MNLIPGDIVFIGDSMALYFGEREGAAQIRLKGSIIAVNPSEVHKPESLSEKLVCLFFTAEGMGLTAEELHFQIKCVLDEDRVGVKHETL